MTPNLRIEALEARRVLASEIAMVGDVNVDLSQLNTDLLLSDQRLLMSRETSASGVELWSYDGSTMQQLTNINPGSGSSNPGALTVHKGDLYFTAFDGIKASLYRIDDIDTNPSQPVQVTNVDANTALVAYGPKMVSLGDDLYFVGVTAGNNPQLLKVNSDVVSVLKEFPVGGLPATESRMAVVGNTLYFAAFESTTGRELWKSDGTAAGTVQVADIRVGTSGSNPNYLVNVSGTLYFRCTPTGAQYEVWRLGAGEVPERVLAASGQQLPVNPIELTNANGRLIFSASSGAGQEVWALNDQQQSFLIKDLMQGGPSSQPYAFTPVGGTVYFTVRNNNFPRRLWRTDFTDAGTVNLPPTATFVRQMTAVDGTLYFSTGNSLWRTSPADNDSVKVIDLPLNGTIFDMQAFGGRAFFTDRGVGGVVWASDGTEAGTSRVEAIDYTASANIDAIVNVNGTLFVSHDTTDGRKGISNVMPDVLHPFLRFASSDGSLPSQLTNVNGSLYFFSQSKLFRYQSTDGQFTEIATFSTANVGLRSLTEVNGNIYFVDASTFSLMKSDGTTAGTTVLKQFSNSSSVTELVNVNGTLYFAANDGTSGVELWKSDGGAANTVMVKNIRAGAQGSAPRYLRNVAGTLMFHANDGTNGYELWKSDGTNAGTVLIKDIFPGTSSSSPQNLTVVGNKLFFIAIDSGGRELWSSDGTATGTVQVRDINPSGSSYPRQLTNVNGKLYFVASDGVEGYELWMSDGTAGETKMVKSLVAGSQSSYITRMTNFNGTLFFTPDIRPIGPRLWQSDGTDAGTKLVSTNSQAMSPEVTYNLAVVGDKLFFGGRTQQFGSELFVLAPVDYGDADTNFTLGSDQGAAHFAVGPMLGTKRDTNEADGVRSAGAIADDINGQDDEDGLLAPVVGSAGGMLTISFLVTNATGNTTASMFFDFNRNGKFSPFPDEQLIDRIQVVEGVNTVSVPVPLDAVPGDSAFRIRISDVSSGEPNGIEQNGEVEDHLFTINRDKVITLTSTKANDILVRKVNDQLLVFDRVAGLSIFAWPLAETTGLQIYGADNQIDKIQVDYAAGGFFELANGIQLFGRSGDDSLIVTGSGTAVGSYNLSSDFRPQTTYTQAAQANRVIYTDFESVLFEGLQSFTTTAQLDVGNSALTITASQPVSLNSNVTIAGGTLSATAFNLASLNSLSGFGSVKGAFHGQTLTVVFATGDLKVGDAASTDGFKTLGTIRTGANTLELLDANQAELGQTTTIGTATAVGTLRAVKGLNLNLSHQINGFGTVETGLDSATALSSAGLVSGTDATRRLKLTGFVTGNGQLNFVETSGTLSPGTPIVLAAYSDMVLSGTLAMEIGGISIGTDYDSIINNGSLALGGTLKVSLLGGHTPATRYRLIQSPATFTGRFTSVDLPAAPAGTRWELGYTSTTVELQLLALAVTIDPARMSENGGTAVGTVARNNMDLSQSLVVSLASSDTTEATVPATVTIPAGQYSATFAITAVDDALLDGSITATITATSSGYALGSASIIVDDSENLALTIAASEMSEQGGSIVGTVTRSNIDISSPLSVTLSSSDTTEGTVPATVTIPANQSAATFAITAVDDTLLDGPQIVTLTALSAGYVSASTSLTVTDVEALSVSIDASSISELNGQATGRVTRNNSDIGAAIIVQLTNSDLTEISIPASVTIPAGQMFVDFTITAVDDTLLDGPQSVSITAAATGYESSTAGLTVTDVETLSLSIDASSISELNGQTTGRVTRNNSDIASAIVVQLTNGDASEISIPASVTIPAGQAFVTFTISAVDDSLLDGTQGVTITAAATGYESVTASLTVTDVENLSLSIDASSISELNGQTTGRVTRNNSDIASAFVVQLTNGDASEISIPASVTIPAGEAFVTFTINAFDDTLLDGTQSVTITAAATGYESSTASLNVTDVETLSFSIDASSISELNGETTGRVTRNNSNIASALVVQLTNGDASELSIPASVTIPAGQAFVTFTISAVDDSLLDGTQSVTITSAATGYESATASLTVTDVETLSLSIDASSISELNGETTGRVTRNNSDIASALVVQLTNGDASELSIRASVTIPAGQTFVTFTISAVDDTLLDGPQSVTITAAATGYESASTSLDVTDVETLSLSIDTSSISELNGQTIGRVTRNNSDIASALDVQLTGGDASEISIPASVTIPAGQAFVTFTISAVDDTLLDGTQSVTITAAATGYESASTSLDVTDVETLSLSIDASSISELNGQTTGRVTRNNSDIASALVVQLTNGDASELSIPASVTIPAGQTFVTFTINAVDDSLLDGTQSVTITAAATGYESATASLTVTDVETLSLSIDASSISELNGQTTGRVTRNNSDIASALVVQLTNGDASELSIPASVTIPAGQTFFTFTINAVDDTLLDGTQGVTITAAATGYESASTSLDVTDVETLSLSIDTSSISELNGQTIGRVTRNNSDIASAVVVQLTNGDASEISIPASVTIPAGQAFVTFTINAVDDSLLDGTQGVTITAGATGYESASTSLTVTDVETLSLSIDTSSINELNGQTTGRVTRNNSDIASAVVVQLTNGDASEISIPASVTIPAGQAFVTFAINAVDDTLLDGPQSVAITAGATGYESASTSLTVTDVETLSLSIDASSISELNGQTTGRVTRNNSDIASALVVQLTNGDASELSIPASVTIPAGQTFVTFTINAVDDSLLDGTQSVTITAAATGYESASTSLTVTDVETLSLSIDASSISELNGQTIGRVTRNNSDIAAALDVQLTGGDASEISIPASVTIPAGQAFFDFTITAVDDTLLDGIQSVIIAAEAAGYESASAGLSVTDVETLSLTIATSSINERNGQTTGRVTRSNTDIAAPLVVPIVVDDTSEVSVPESVTIPAGQSFVEFTISAKNDTLVDGPQTVQIVVASAGYIGEAQAELTVADDDRLHPWQSPRNPLDVNDSGQVTALDALLVINALNTRQVLTPELPDPFIPVAYVDVNGDDVVTPIDALLVINRLNQPGSSEGEGDFVPLDSAAGYWNPAFDETARRRGQRGWESLDDLVELLSQDRLRLN